MKQLMMVAVALVGLTAFTQEFPGPEGAGAEGRRGGPRAAERRAPARAPQGEVGNDPAVRAVMNPRIADQLGLSDEVQLAIKKIDLDSRKEVKALQQQTRAAMAKQAKLMREEKPDEAAVMAAIDELFECRKAMAKAQTKKIIAIRSLLTSEQLAGAAEALKAERAGRKDRPGKDRPGMEGPGKECSGKDCAEGDRPPMPPPEAGDKE